MPRDLHLLSLWPAGPGRWSVSVGRHGSIRDLGGSYASREDALRAALGAVPDGEAVEVREAGAVRLLGAPEVAELRARPLVTPTTARGRRQARRQGGG